MIEQLKAEGLDLSVDVIDLSITYPEHPEVLINISVGGMFHEEDINGEVH
jgi:hypothetical protein